MSIAWRPGISVRRRATSRSDEVFDSLAADFADSVAEKGLRWRMVRSELVVRSDKGMLGAMLRNLLSNAVRYTDRGAILLGCRRAGDNIRIEVWDSGIGISRGSTASDISGVLSGRGWCGARRLRIRSGYRQAYREAYWTTESMCARHQAKARCFRLRFRAETQAMIPLEKARTPRFEKRNFPDIVLVVEDESERPGLAKSPAENERHRRDRGRHGG